MEVSSVHMSSTDRVPQNWELLTTLSVLATSSVFAVRSYTTRVVVPHLLRFSSPQRLNNTTTRRLLRPSSLLRVCTLDNKFHVVRTQDLPSVTSYQSVKFLKVLSSATLKRTWATVEEWLVCSRCFSQSRIKPDSYQAPIWTEEIDLLDLSCYDRYRRWWRSCW